MRASRRPPDSRLRRPLHNYCWVSGYTNGSRSAQNERGRHGQNVPKTPPRHSRTLVTSFLPTHPRHSRTHHHVIPATPCRHSRVGGNLDTRYYGACLDVGPILRRPPRRAGAEERGACGDEEAAGEEEQEQQAARYAGAPSSGELVRRNGRRRYGRCRRRGHRRASRRHRWRWRGSGRPGCYDVIRSSRREGWSRSSGRRRW